MVIRRCPRNNTHLRMVLVSVLLATLMLVLVLLVSVLLVLLVQVLLLMLVLVLLVMLLVSVLLVLATRSWFSFLIWNSDASFKITSTYRSQQATERIEV